MQSVAKEGKLPVVLFCAGGVSTPADAALMMQLGAEGIFVGQRHLQVERLRATSPRRSSTRPRISTTPKVVMEACRSLGESEAMHGIDVRTLDATQLFAARGN